MIDDKAMRKRLRLHMGMSQEHPSYGVSMNETQVLGFAAAERKLEREELLKLAKEGAAPELAWHEHQARTNHSPLDKVILAEVDRLRALVASLLRVPPRNSGTSRAIEVLREHSKGAPGSIHGLVVAELDRLYAQNAKEREENAALVAAQAAELDELRAALLTFEREKGSATKGQSNMTETPVEKSDDATALEMEGAYQDAQRRYAYMERPEAHRLVWLDMVAWARDACKPAAAETANNGGKGNG